MIGRRSSDPERAPVFLSYGAGVDSTALGIELVRRGAPVDRFLFADTGGEKPETYAYLRMFSAWLEGSGYPAVEVVKYRPVRAPYNTLEENCHANETLPSLSFGRRGCSIKWKHEVMDRHLDGVARGPNRAQAKPEVAAARATGRRPWRLIGYDAGEVERGRGRRRGTLITEDARWRYRYPLVEWGWTRARCVAEIAAEGLPVPPKSACFFCPASKPWELYALAANHPQLFLRALAIEDGARRGRHGIGEVGGLGGYAGPAEMKSWRRWAELEGIIERGGHEVVLEADHLRRLSEEAKDDSAGGCQLRLWRAAA